MRTKGRRALASLLLLSLSACSSRESSHARRHAPPREHSVDYDPSVHLPPPTAARDGSPLIHPDFRWPVADPVVINYFGWRRRHLHEGIDIRAHTGTPIFAAASGEVIHAGTGIRGYGKLVVIEHGGGWSTAYAHLSKVEVRVGMRVRGGQRLGLSGRTGRAKGPHLHFEIRKESDPLDPLLLMPSGYATKY